MNHQTMETIQAAEAEKTRYQCRYIFTDGHRCGSPALREENFCYFHHSTRLPIQDVPKRRRRQCRFTVRMPEDRSSIQLTLGEVLQKLANNDLDPRRAGLLLYGLQIASLNLPKRAPDADPVEPVSEITIDPTAPALGPLAPIEEYHGPDSKKKGTLHLWLEDMNLAGEDDKECHDRPGSETSSALTNQPGDCQRQEQVHPDPCPLIPAPLIPIPCP